MVVWDTTRPDHLTPYGYDRDTTPNLARIAEQAAIFDQAVSPAPWTIPSVASILTGLYVHNHKVSFAAENYAPILPEQAITLAETLEEAGYATALYTQQAIFLANESYCQGFDDCTREFQDLVGRSLRFVDEAEDQPVFVVTYWLHPHAPYTPTSTHDLWSDPDGPDVNIDVEVEAPGYYHPKEVNTGRVVLDESQYRQLIAQYDGELHANDAQLGRYWSELDKRGLTDESIFIFLSDHGEAFGEHPKQRVWHHWPFETILRVPLIIRYPAKIRPGRYDELVSTVDIYPTLLDLLDREIDQPLNGISLRKIISGERTRDAIAGASHQFGGILFFRDDQHKLFYTRARADEVGAYDLLSDPLERQNLAENEPEKVDRLRKQLVAFLRETAIEIDGAGVYEQSPEQVEAETERLRALGYVD